MLEADLRVTALFGPWSLLPYALYLASVYVLNVRLPLAATLAASTLAWVLAAALLLAVWLRTAPHG